MSTSTPNIILDDSGGTNDGSNVGGEMNASIDNSKARRRLRSDVWVDFEKKTSEEGADVAICKHCKRKFGASSESGTSHLRKNLKRCPRKQSLDVGQQLIMAKKNVNDGTNSVKCFKFDQERSRLDLARMIIKHEYAFSIIDHEYFREFVNNLQPLFNLVTRNTIKADILKIYNDEKETLYKSLDKLLSRISLTTDLWTSETNDAYLCLTGHYIDDDWMLQKRILNFVFLESGHSAEELFQIIMNCLLDWNIDEKLFSCTVDNASTNDVMLAILRRKLAQDGLLVANGDFLHVRCTTHILNLIVKDGLSIIEKVITKIRDSCKFVRLTPKRKLMWQSAVDQVKIPTKRKVCLDVSTRWNSTFLMLEIALEYKEAFNRLAQREADFKTNPSVEEWEMAKTICSCLKVFYESTNTLSGTKYPTSNIYFSEVCEIHLNLLEWRSSDDLTIKMMANCMWEKFNKYWSICSMVLAVATVLDPRCKMKFVEYNYHLIYGHDADLYAMKVKTVLQELYMDYVSNSYSLDRNSQAWSGAIGSSSQSPHSAMKQSFNKFKRFESWYLREGLGSVTQKSELDQYLDEPIFPNNEEFMILNWWKMNSPKYPSLSRMARDVLSIPVSSVASESTFSTGGRVLNDYRASLAPETLEALICSQNWINSNSKVDTQSFAHGMPTT